MQTTHTAKTVRLDTLVETAYATSARTVKCPTAISPTVTYLQAIHTCAPPVRLASQLMHGAAVDASCAAMDTSQSTTTRDASGAHLEKLAPSVSATIATVGQKKTPTVQLACLAHRDKLAWMASAIPVQTDTGQTLYYPHVSSAPAAGPALMDFARLAVMAKNPVADIPIVEIARMIWSARAMNANCAKLGSLSMNSSISAKAAQLAFTATRSSCTVTELASASTQPTAHSNRTTPGQHGVSTIALASTRAYSASFVHRATRRKATLRLQVASLAESSAPHSTL